MTDAMKTNKLLGDSASILADGFNCGCHDRPFLKPVDISASIPGHESSVPKMGDGFKNRCNMHYTVTFLQALFGDCTGMD
jgi:hypothetical protein